LYTKIRQWSLLYSLKRLRENGRRVEDMWLYAWDKITYHDKSNIFHFDHSKLKFWNSKDEDGDQFPINHFMYLGYSTIHRRLSTIHYSDHFGSENSKKMKPLKTFPRASLLGNQTSLKQIAELLRLDDEKNSFRSLFIYTQISQWDWSLQNRRVYLGKEGDKTIAYWNFLQYILVKVWNSYFVHVHRKNRNVTR